MARPSTDPTTAIPNVNLLDQQEDLLADPLLTNSTPGRSMTPRAAPTQQPVRTAVANPLVTVTERLHREFPKKTLAELIEVVGQCLYQIDTGASDECIPELVERLARARLEAASHDVSTRPPPEPVDS